MKAIFHDIDHAVQLRLAAAFNQEHNKDLSQNFKAMNRLLEAARKARISFCDDTSYRVKIEAILPGIDFQFDLKRDDF